MSTIITRLPSYGEVYTRPWVVELILNLAGYVSDVNLVDAVAIEPAAGRGAFVTSMAERLVASCTKQGRPVTDCLSSIKAYERDANSAAHARLAVIRKLLDLNVSSPEAEALATHWIKSGNYLLDFGKRLEAVRNSPLSADKFSPDQQADYVIGNPPYIRLEDIPAKENAAYRKLFRTMKGRSDIYVAFYEAALLELKPGGVCAFICADRWMLNQYGAELRRLITEGYSVEFVIEMHHAEAFETEVNAYPAITVIRRAQQAEVLVGSANSAAEHIDTVALTSALKQLAQNGSDKLQLPGVRLNRMDTWFGAAEPWVRTSPDQLLLLRQLERDFIPLESETTGTRVGIGVATGIDAVYITEDATVVEHDRLLPLALTSDLQSGCMQWSGHYLVNPWAADGLIDLERYPKLRAYFLKHQHQIRERNVAKRSAEAWYRTIDRVEMGLLESPKLYIPDIKSVIFPVLDDGITYPHHNLYYIVSRKWNLEVLGALLMSDVGRFFVECYGVRMRGGYLRMQAQYLRRIRLPRPESISAQSVKDLIAAFRTRDTEWSSRLALKLYGIEHIPH